MIKIVKKITMIAAMTAVMLTTTITPTISTTTSSTTTVFAASGYSGKIYKHWCRMRKSKSKKAKTIKKLKIGTKVKSIRLVPDAADGHDIECKIDGFGAMKLKSSVVKKA